MTATHATRKAKQTKAKHQAKQTKAKHQAKQKTTTRSKKSIYKILDNGGTPYVVEITPTAVCIEDNKKKKIYKTPYEHVFLGEGRLTGAIYRKGSSILIQQSPTNYVYVGSEIYSFRTTEPIVAYESPVGPSETPYPYAIGAEYTYFMLDKEKVPNLLLDLKKDAYGQFYGYTVSKKEEAMIEKKKTAFASKPI